MRVRFAGHSSNSGIAPRMRNCRLSLAIRLRNGHPFAMPLRSLFFSLPFWCLPAFSLFPRRLPVRSRHLSDPALKLEALRNLSRTWRRRRPSPPRRMAPSSSAMIRVIPGSTRRTRNARSSAIRASGRTGRRPCSRTSFTRRPAWLWHDGWLYVIHDPLLTRFKDTKGDGRGGCAGGSRHRISARSRMRGSTITWSAASPSAWTASSTSAWATRACITRRARTARRSRCWGGGIVRVRPDGTHLEVYSGGTRNHLEVDLDAMDHAFTLDNTDDGNGWWTRLTHHDRERLLRLSVLFQE